MAWKTGLFILSCTVLLSVTSTQKFCNSRHPPSNSFLSTLEFSEIRVNLQNLQEKQTLSPRRTDNDPANDISFLNTGCPTDSTSVNTTGTSTSRGETSVESTSEQDCEIISIASSEATTEQNESIENNENLDPLGMPPLLEQMEKVTEQFRNFRSIKRFRKPRPRFSRIMDYNYIKYLMLDSNWLRVKGLKIFEEMRRIYPEMAVFTAFQLKYRLQYLLHRKDYFFSIFMQNVLPTEKDRNTFEEFFKFLTKFAIRSEDKRAMLQRQSNLHRFFPKRE